MTTGLVGSEMCIRDSDTYVTAKLHAKKFADPRLPDLFPYINNTVFLEPHSFLVQLPQAYASPTKSLYWRSLLDFGRPDILMKNYYSA